MTRDFTLAPISLEALISVHPVSWLFEGQTAVAVGPAGALIVFGPEIEGASCCGVVYLTVVSLCHLRSALPRTSSADEVGGLTSRPPWLAGALSLDVSVLPGEWHPDLEW